MHEEYRKKWDHEMRCIGQALLNMDTMFTIEDLANRVTDPGVAQMVRDRRNGTRVCMMMGKWWIVRVNNPNSKRGRFKRNGKLVTYFKKCNDWGSKPVPEGQ